MTRTPRRTRRLLLIGVAVSLVVAGAAAVLATNGDLPTPFESPETDDQRLAPGVYANDTVNVTRLLQAHRTRMRASGFRSETVVTSQTNGSVVVASGQHVTAAPNLTSVRVRQNRSSPDGGNATVRVYSNETTTLVRQTVDGNVSYQVRERTRGRTVPPISRATLSVLGRVGENFTVENVTGTDQQRRTTLTADIDESGAADAQTQVTMVVDGQGVVRSLTVRQAGGTGTIESRYRLGELGVSGVDRPDWVRDVPSNATRETTTETGYRSAGERDPRSSTSGPVAECADAVLQNP